MDIIKDIAAVVGLLTALFGLATAIIKPLRQAIRNTFSKKSSYNELLETVKEIKNQQDEAINKQNEMIIKLDKVEKNVLENESDRLKSELFACGNRCRRGIKLHSEEMAHIREVYHKYHDTLKQNHDGSLEYEFILNYYNSQSANNNTK